jgi:methylamine--corrinoid protein Co-methyltransferase
LVNSNRLPEIVNRSETGPYAAESDFDLMLVRKIPELVAEHGIKFDPDVLVPADDDMADRLYQAAVELFVEIGAYNQTSERRIMFARDETEEIVAQQPRSIVLGTGQDAIVEQHRDVESMIPCRVHSGPTGTPSSERYHRLILQSCAQEPLVDCLGAGSVSTYMGRQIVPGSPTEIMGTRRDSAEAREAIRKAGRPGMHIEDNATPLTCQGKMAAVDRNSGLRPSDGMLVSQMVEMKTDYDQLSRVAFMQSIGMHIVDLLVPLVGGIGGGAEGTALLTVAEHILGAVLYHPSYHFMGHMHLMRINNTDRMGLWIQAMAGQALARNTPMVVSNDIYCVSGTGTSELLWEVAAGAMVGAVCGTHQHGMGVAGGATIDQTTGLEARFQAQVAHAALGMTRDEVNELVLECMTHYEDRLDEPNPGKSFPELYDVDTLEPNDEWLRHYASVSEALTTMGLDIGGAWKRVLSDRGQSQVG